MPRQSSLWDRTIFTQVWYDSKFGLMTIFVNRTSSKPLLVLGFGLLRFLTQSQLTKPSL